jgi:hypothetical protein
MLFTPDITRTGRIIGPHQTLNEFQIKIVAICIYSGNIEVKQLLNSNGLLLIEMLNHLDYEAIESSPELCDKINTLYRFITSLR